MGENKVRLGVEIPTEIDSRMEIAAVLQRRKKKDVIAIALAEYCDRHGYNIPAIDDGHQDERKSLTVNAH